MAIAAITTVTHTPITVANATTAVAAANADRKWLLVVNDSDETIYVKIGAAAVMNQGIRINAAGGSLELTGGSLNTGAVNGICSSGGKKLLVTEGV
jgi:hypothetical protein